MRGASFLPPVCGAGRAAGRNYLNGTWSEHRRVVPRLSSTIPEGHLALQYSRNVKYT